MEIYSPYRICPLGAHIDHQLGIVIGTTINRGIRFIFEPNSAGLVRLHSLDYDESIEFSFADTSRKAGHWSDYARGAACVLQLKEKLKYGIDAEIQADFPGGGLSSSAAIAVAYLLALEKVNNLHIPAGENIKLVQKLENEYIGLKNGILDQSIILLTKSMPNSMVYLDCKTLKHKIIAPGKSANSPRPLRERGADAMSKEHRLARPPSGEAGDRSPSGQDRLRGNEAKFEVAVVYSGIEQALSNTGYNRRVTECEEAASLLMEMADQRLPHRRTARNNKMIRLRDVPEEVFQKYKDKLPANLRKRATHFFTEMDRVRKGVLFWKSGDLKGFGKLMTDSGKSSIENYECGTPALIRIYELLNSVDGIYGARFSGAGFRGSCIGLIKPSEKVRDTVREKIAKHYKVEFPQYADKCRIVFCKTNIQVSSS